MCPFLAKKGKGIDKPGKTSQCKKLESFRSGVPIDWQYVNMAQQTTHQTVAKWEAGIRLAGGVGEPEINQEKLRYFKKQINKWEKKSRETAEN